MRDFTTPRSPGVRVSFDVRTVYDFVFSLGEDAGETDDLPAADRAWLETARAALRNDLAAEGPSDLEHITVILAGLVVDRPEVRTAADFVRLLDSVPESLVIETILAEDLRDPAPSAIAARALAG
ncbi:MAG TPA: hypothetical protein VEY67_06975, partial [Candidatus Dormibacteraeota bacterium]|nr:hypothetical protein [Candidatus Dormibacteraeota bacterium]